MFCVVTNHSKAADLHFYNFQVLRLLSEFRNQNKSAVARAGILDYLQRQQQLEAQKRELEASIEVSRIEAVQKRVAESESSYRLSDEEYEQSMNEFFARELGLVR